MLLGGCNKIPAKLLLQFFMVFFRKSTNHLFNTQSFEKSEELFDYPRIPSMWHLKRHILHYVLKFLKAIKENYGSYPIIVCIALKKESAVGTAVQLRTRLKMQRLFSICMQSCLFGNCRKIFTMFENHSKSLILQHCERSEQQFFAKPILNFCAKNQHVPVQFLVRKF